MDETKKHKQFQGLHQRIIEVVKAIPPGKVATYGQVASLAGNYRAARQVAWVLHASSEKENLPWFRVINGKGRISLPPGGGYEHQKHLLEAEGIRFNSSAHSGHSNHCAYSDVVDLKQFLWVPDH